MPFKDLRQFIEELTAVGECQRIDEEVDWNLEAGAIVRRANENGLPSPFFQNIKGYPDGYRVLGTPLGKHRRLAIAMGMAADTPPRILIEDETPKKVSLATIYPQEVQQRALAIWGKYGY